MMQSLSQQRGVALIIVLLVVALVSILATEMGSRLQLQVMRAANIKDNNQAYWYAMGAEQYAHQAIKTLLEENNNIVSASQPWTQPLTYPVEGGVIEAQLQDAQACFNLNALVSDDPADSKHIALLNAFKTLLSDDELGIDDYQRDIVVDALADWLDSDSNLRNYGAEDADYESLLPPYLPANGPMLTQSEFRLIKGVSPKWIMAVMPYICAIPEQSELKININTLNEDQALLLAALTGLDKGSAQRQLSSRPQDGYDDIQKFFNEQEIAALNLTDTQKSWFTVSSEHFMLHTKSRYNKATFSMRSLIKATSTEVTVIRREFGG